MKRLAAIQLMFVNNDCRRVTTCSLHQSHVAPTDADPNILDTSCYEDMVETHECSSEDLMNEPGTLVLRFVSTIFWSGTHTVLKPRTRALLESGTRTVLQSVTHTLLKSARFFCCRQSLRWLQYLAARKRRRR